jgi:transposase
MQLYAGLDVHSKNTVGTIVDENGNPMLELEVPTTQKGFHTLFARYAGKHRLKAVYEASRNWTYIAELLHEEHVETVMAHPLKVRAIASARIKTDTIDSKILAHLLRTNLIPESYMPPHEIVTLRTLVRYRVSLGRIRAQCKNRIRSVLAREGKNCEWTDPCGVKARLWLTHLELTAINRHEITYALNMLESLNDEIECIDEKIHKEATLRPDVALLSSIPGFAEYSSLLILAEIGDVKRFETPQKLAAYAGLVSSTYQSGNSCYQGHITKQGNKWLRWILVECATLAIRKENRLKRFYNRLARKKGHQKAIVATARKTLTIMWTLLHKQEVFRP